MSARAAVKLTGDERSDRAAARVLVRLLDLIEASLPGTIAGADPELLHDFRVAVRRTRAVQRELKAVFAPEPLSRFRAEFRRLQRVTGQARDLDVYVLEFGQFRDKLPMPVRADLDPLLAVLSERRARAREEIVDALSSDRTRTVLARWREFLTRLGNSDLAGPQAEVPIKRLAGERITKVYGRMVRTGGTIGVSSPAEDYHQLRKQGKELRYLLELFGRPLYAADAVKPLVKKLKALQSTLGRHQDREVQISTMRALAEPVAAMRGGTDGLIAMGMLIERMQEDLVRAREEFGDRFATFASRPERKLLKETFG